MSEFINKIVTGIEETKSQQQREEAEIAKHNNHVEKRHLLNMVSTTVKALELLGASRDEMVLGDDYVFIDDFGFILSTEPFVKNPSIKQEWSFDRSCKLIGYSRSDSIPKGTSQKEMLENVRSNANYYMATRFQLGVCHKSFLDMRQFDFVFKHFEIADRLGVTAEHYDMLSRMISSARERHQKALEYETIRVKREEENKRADLLHEKRRKQRELVSALQGMTVIIEDESCQSDGVITVRSPLLFEFGKNEVEVLTSIRMRLPNNCVLMAIPSATAIITAFVGEDYFLRVRLTATTNTPVKMAEGGIIARLYVVPIITAFFVTERVDADQIPVSENLDDDDDDNDNDDDNYDLDYDAF